jgi:hypothetical protein
MKTLGYVVAFCFLLSALPVDAQLFKRDPGDEIELPDEESLQLPAPPKEDNLLSFDPGYVVNLSFYIDAASLKVGETDRIVRYTLVIKSPSGASNISYEGLRCDSFERKIYAYAAPDGSWLPVRDPQWKFFDKEVYRQTLFNDFFCSARMGRVRSVREAIQMLNSGGYPRVTPN